MAAKLVSAKNLSPRSRVENHFRDKLEKCLENENVSVYLRNRDEEAEPPYVVMNAGEGNPLHTNSPAFRFPEATVTLVTHICDTKVEEHERLYKKILDQLMKDERKNINDYNYIVRIHGYKIQGTTPVKNEDQKRGDVIVLIIGAQV